jgi:hypothetical protein
MPVNWRSNLLPSVIFIFFQEKLAIGRKNDLNSYLPVKSLGKDINREEVFNSYRKKRMKKYPLIEVSIVAVVVLILASLSNVVGFQTVQSTIKKIINDEVNQKDLLFQTIVDIVNNKEIQRIVLKSQISRSGIFNSDARLALFKAPVLTKNLLNHMYIVGLMLSKIISKSKIHLMVQQHQLVNQGIQNKINAVIEKDATLNSEITRLSNSKCDCGNDNTTVWTFPIICLLLAPLVIIAWYLYFLGGGSLLGNIVFAIGGTLHCFWV